MTRYVLTLNCSDAPGIVHAVTGALLEVEANITESAQYEDSETSVFTMRVVFDSPASRAEVVEAVTSVGRSLSASVSIRPLHERRRALLMVSRYEHCLLDLLYRHRNGELAIDIPLIISNHPDCAGLAERYGIPFEHIPVTAETKPEAEAILLQRIEENDVDFVVLARYMQVLSDDVCQVLAGRVINIHHSFLPGFKGARPYHQAHARGVKLIGATAHYVTPDLDEGPIIEQDVARVDHADTADDMVSIGRDVERVVLSRAVRLQAEDRVILVGSKTIVFP